MSKKITNHKKLLLEVLFDSEPYTVLQRYWKDGKECCIPEKYQETVIGLILILDAAYKEEIITLQDLVKCQLLIRFVFSSEESALSSRERSRKLYFESQENMLDAVMGLIKTVLNERGDEKILMILREFKKFVDFSVNMDVINDDTHKNLLKYFINNFIYDK